MFTFSGLNQSILNIFDNFKSQPSSKFNFLSTHVGPSVKGNRFGMGTDRYQLGGELLGHFILVASWGDFLALKWPFFNTFNFLKSQAGAKFNFPPTHRSFISIRNKLGLGVGRFRLGQRHLGHFILSASWGGFLALKWPSFNIFNIFKSQAGAKFNFPPNHRSFFPIRNKLGLEVGRFQFGQGHLGHFIQKVSWVGGASRSSFSKNFTAQNLKSIHFYVGSKIFQNPPTSLLARPLCFSLRVTLTDKLE